jgi:hypothetical protein
MSVKITRYCQLCSEPFVTREFGGSLRCYTCSVKNRNTNVKTKNMTPDEYADNVLNSIHESKRKLL